MKIKLNTVMASARGNHGIGCVLTVGKEIDKESADHLIKTKQAELCDEVKKSDEKSRKVDDSKEEKTNEPAPEEAEEVEKVENVKQVQQESKRKKQNRR